MLVVVISDCFILVHKAVVCRLNCDVQNEALIIVYTTSRVVFNVVGCRALAQGQPIRGHSRTSDKCSSLFQQSSLME